MLAKTSVAVCLLAAIATVFLIVPDDYCRLTTVAEFVYLGVILGPYLLLALLAWCNRGKDRVSRALMVLILLLTLAGLVVLQTESSGYRSEVRAFVIRDPARGAEYIKERLQRAALFVVPALQWLVALLAGGAVLLGGKRK